MKSIDYTDTAWLPIGFVAGVLDVDSSTLRRWHKRGLVEGRRQVRDPRLTGPVRLPWPTLHFRIADVRPVVLERLAARYDREELPPSCETD